MQPLWTDEIILCQLNTIPSHLSWASLLSSSLHHHHCTQRLSSLCSTGLNHPPVYTAATRKCASTSISFRILDEFFTETDAAMTACSCCNSIYQTARVRSTKTCLHFRYVNQHPRLQHIAINATHTPPLWPFRGKLGLAK